MAKYFWKKPLLPYLSSTFDIDEAEQGLKMTSIAILVFFSENK
jgi:hypothetical protein